ncbi:recombinase family protein [Vibrio harveyi]|uniref:recombinase family protein n=1 Tax=Vibrio harveyi TaxID=669 RepID=UPI003737113A
MAKNAVALVRVSTTIQEHGQGIDRQDSEIATFLTSHPDYELTRTISAIGQSAFSGVVHDSDSEFGQFLSSIESNPSTAPHALLLASIDRLTRLPFFEATALVNRILEAIQELVICDSGKVYSKAGGSDLGSIMELTMKIQLANEESEQKSRRLRAAREKRKHKIANKTKIPNYLPFWLCWSGKDYEFTEHVKTVRKMVELRLSGMGAVAIQSYLNEHLDTYPVPQRKSKQASATRWTKSRIDDILFKEVTITGDYLIKTTYTPEEKREAKRNNIKLPAYNRDLDFVIEGLFPAVVDKVTYAKLKTGTGKGKQTNAYYNVFRGLAKCTCGSSCVTSHDTKKHDLDDRLYIKCNSRNQSGRVSECKNPSTKLFPLARSILNYLISFPITSSKDETKVSRADELELQIKEQKELRDRFRRLSTKAATLEDEDYYLSELKTVSGTLKALEVEYKLAIHEEASSADSNIVLENLKKVRIDTPEGRLEVNSQLRQIIDVMVIDNITPLVKVTFKDGTVTEFDPNEVGDIAESHDMQFNYDRDQEDDLSDFDFND